MLKLELLSSDHYAGEFYFKIKYFGWDMYTGEVLKYESLIKFTYAPYFISDMNLNMPYCEDLESIPAFIRKRFKGLFK